MGAPALRSIVLCDQVITDAHSGKHSLIGVFEVFWSRVFPWLHPNMGVFLSLTDVSKGAHDLRLEFRYLSEEGDTLIAQALGPVDAPTAGPLNVGVNLSPVALPQPGQYALEVFVDGQLLGRHSVAVTRAPEATT